MPDYSQMFQAFNPLKRKVLPQGGPLALRSQEVPQGRPQYQEMPFRVPNQEAPQGLQGGPMGNPMVNPFAGGGQGLQGGPMGLHGEGGPMGNPRVPNQGAPMGGPSNLFQGGGGGSPFQGHQQPLLVPNQGAPNQGGGWGSPFQAQQQPIQSGWGSPFQGGPIQGGGSGVFSRLRYGYQ